MLKVLKKTYNTGFSFLDEGCITSCYLPFCVFLPTLTNTQRNATQQTLVIQYMFREKVIES